MKIEKGARVIAENTEVSAVMTVEDIDEHGIAVCSYTEAGERQETSFMLDELRLATEEEIAASDAPAASFPLPDSEAAETTTDGAKDTREWGIGEDGPPLEELPKVAIMLLIGEWAKAEGFPGARTLPPDRYDGEGNRWSVTTVEAKAVVRPDGSMHVSGNSYIRLSLESRQFAAENARNEKAQHESAKAAVLSHVRSIKTMLGQTGENELDRRRQFNEAIQVDELKLAEIDEKIAACEANIESESLQLYKYPLKLEGVKFFVSQL